MTFRQTLSLLRAPARLLAYSLTFCLLAYLPTCLRSQSEDLNQLIPSLMSQANVPGLSIVVLDGGRVTFGGAFGVRSNDGGSQVDDQTVFAAASLSKPVLAFAVMQLVEEGKFDLEKPLAEYLEYEDLKHDPRYRQITARMVLSHTSGLPNWRSGQRLELSGDPGERFRYSGEGFVYLQKVIERITGTPLETLAQQKVFKPLGMERTSFVWQKSFDGNYAVPHDELGVTQSKTKPAEANAAYSLQTTAADYAKFVIALMNGIGMRKTAIDQMLASQSKVPAGGGDRVILSDAVTWSLGWGLQETEQGKAFWHWGDNGTFRCFILANIERKSGLIFFTNSHNGLSFVEKIVQATLGVSCPACNWIDYVKYDQPAFRLPGDILAKGLDAALAPYLDPNGRHQNTSLISEGLMNELGYRLMRMNRLDDAIRVFRMNTLAFPNSSNVYDSYAEACLRSGDQAAARENYQKAFDLDKSNKTAESVAKQLAVRVFGNTTFKLEGYSNARLVTLAGDFNGWNNLSHPFKRSDGEWSCTVELAPGTHKYKFVVDGVWIPDPANQRFSDDGNQNSVIEVKGVVRTNTLAAASPAAAAASSPARDLVNRYAEAAGGKEKWKEFKTCIMTFRNTQGASNVKLTTTMKKPNKFRSDLDNASNRLTKSYNGTKGVVSINYRSQDMGIGEQKEMAEEPDFFDELMFAEEKGYVTDLLGKQPLENGREAYKIKLVKAKGDEQTYLLDAETLLPAAMLEYSQDENFKGVLFKTVLENYQAVDGLMFPFKITLLANDKVMWERTVESVKVNPKVEDKVFEIK